MDPGCNDLSGIWTGLFPRATGKEDAVVRKALQPVEGS